MPLTPLATLPMDLTSDSEKCAAFPAFETNIIYLLPSVTVVPTSSSPSRRVIAFLPPFL